MSPWLPLLITPLMLAGAAALTQRYFTGAEGSGIPQTIAAIRMPNGPGRDRVLSLHLAAAKMLLTCVGQAGGASVGREGSTVQLARRTPVRPGRWRAGREFGHLLLAFSAHGLPGRAGVFVRGHPVYFAAISGSLLALIGLASGNAVYGSGYAEARHLLEGSAEVSAGYGLWKMLATFVSFISGIPGGLFAPSLSAGAGVGQVVAMVTQAESGALVVIGSGIFCGRGAGTDHRVCHRHGND